MFSQQQMRDAQKQPVRTALPACFSHSLTFNFVESMDFSEQPSTRLQPQRASADERARICRAKYIQFPERYHDEIERFIRAVCADILLYIVDIQAGFLRLLTGPAHGCR